MLTGYLVGLFWASAKALSRSLASIASRLGQTRSFWLKAVLTRALGFVWERWDIVYLCLLLFPGFSILTREQACIWTSTEPLSEQELRDTLCKSRQSQTSISVATHFIHPKHKALRLCKPPNAQFTSLKTIRHEVRKTLNRDYRPELNPRKLLQTYQKLLQTYQTHPPKMKITNKQKHPSMFLMTFLPIALPRWRCSSRLSVWPARWACRGEASLERFGAPVVFWCGRGVVRRFFLGF